MQEFLEKSLSLERYSFIAQVLFKPYSECFGTFH
jgi:hypothetical protein